MKELECGMIFQTQLEDVVVSVERSAETLRWKLQTLKWELARN